LTLGYGGDAEVEAALEAILTAWREQRDEAPVVAFVCNWDAYRALEELGRQRLAYPPNVLPFRVMCLGRLSTGMLLKAFELGASKVLMLGCGTDDCHFGFGSRRVEEVYEQAKAVLKLLGFGGRLRMEKVGAGDVERMREVLQKARA